MKKLRKIRGIYITVGIMLLLVVFLSQCGKSKTQSANEMEYSKISPSDLKIMMETKDFHLINVHVPYDGEIPGTDMFIPYTEIGEKLDLPKNSKIVLYCRSGPMSKGAAESLIKNGYTNIYDLENGMNGWKQEGYEIIHKPQGQGRQKL